MAAAVEFFDVKTAAGVLHLAARRLPYSESRRFAVRYSSLGEKDRLKELAKNIFTAEGKRLASARTLSLTPTDTTFGTNTKNSHAPTTKRKKTKNKTKTH